MIKTHNVTGLKYLCKSEQEGENLRRYVGSGKYWLSHLKKHGRDISTEYIFESDDRDEFITFARSKSIEWNIVDSDEWANLKLEEGDGGTVLFTEEHRKKISRALTGRKLTQEHVDKIQASTAGKHGGWHHSPEYVEVIRNRKPFLGRKHTEETRRKMSEAAKRRKQNGSV